MWKNVLRIIICIYNIYVSATLLWQLMHRESLFYLIVYSLKHKTETVNSLLLAKNKFKNAS